MERTEQLSSSESLNTPNRIIGEAGVDSGPTIIFIAGLHGNEKSGVLALEEAMRSLQEGIRGGKIKPCGKVYAIAGNLKALEQNKRYVEEDLNRSWTLDRVDKIQRNHDDLTTSEESEMSALLNCFEDILKKSDGPYYFIDLHSTSARTVPHIVINDRLENRELSFKYPLPVILGIDSFVDGTLLSFVNEMGHRAIGFEGGRHDQPHTIQSMLAFFWLTLVNTGFMKKRRVSDFKVHFDRLLISSQGHRQVYEIFHRFQVDREDQFSMVPGYTNFQPVIKGQYLADDGKTTILAREHGYIFLPRYEALGNSGFYLLKKLSKSWLGLSSFLQKIRFERVLVMLPGVKKSGEVEEAYQVNKKLARFFAAELFHLLGYRRLLSRDGSLVVAKKHVRSRN